MIGVKIHSIPGRIILGEDSPVYQLQQVPSVGETVHTHYLGRLAESLGRDEMSEWIVEAVDWWYASPEPTIQSIQAVVWVTQPELASSLSLKKQPTTHEVADGMLRWMTAANPANRIGDYDALPLSTRARNVLAKAKITLFSEISQDGLEELKRCGKGTVKEIMAWRAANYPYESGDLALRS